jgi:hypothetical protein
MIASFQTLTCSLYKIVYPFYSTLHAPVHYYYYYYYYYYYKLQLSLGGSSPYTSTDKTNKNKCT